MRTNLFLLIFLLSALGLTAQNSGCTITGVVREYDLNMHKQALDGVEVRISVGGTRSDITENGGHFTIENIPYCKPGTKIQTDKNSFLKPGYELFYPDALDFWRVPNSTASGSTEILMCKSSRINEVRQKLFKVVDQHHKKLYEQKKAELEKAHLEARELEQRLIILESQLRDTAQMMKVVNEWLYLDRMKCDSVMNLAYSHFENGEYDRACEIMNSYEMKSAGYYTKKLHGVEDEVIQAIQFVKHRLKMNFANGGSKAISLIERDCDFLIDIYAGQLEDAANDTEGMRGDTNTLKKNLAAAYAFKGDISLLSDYVILNEIISNYRIAAELGNAHAQYKMGEIYENVLNYDVHIQSDDQLFPDFNTSFMFNLDSARLWYEKAAEQGDPSAIQRMLWFYDFSAKDKNGNEIYYHIMSDEQSVMAVKKSVNDGSYSDYLNIVLPKKVTNNKVEYNVTAIREQTFKGCGQLKSLFIPNSVVEIGSQAFAFCQNLEYIKCEVNGTFYTDKEEMMLIKRQEQGDELVSFAVARRDVHDVIIPDHVTKIGDGAFAFGEMLYVVIPNTVVTIGKEAFLSCWRLDSIVIPNSVTNIGVRAFYACKNMQSLTMSESLTTIEHQSFAQCLELKSVSIPASVKIIKKGAFLQCFNLESVIIPNSVTTIGDKAFFGCWKLKNVIVPNSVTTVGTRTFSQCYSLESVSLPNSVVTIGDGTFAGCPHLSTINCEVGGVFSTDESGTMLFKRLDEGCELVAFAQGSNVVEVNIPNSVTTIGYEAFHGCKNLGSITIPNSVTTIGDFAFEDCYSLEIVSISNPKTTISGLAFVGCSPSLIKNPKVVPELWGFDPDWDYYGMLLVPSGSVDAYRNYQVPSGLIYQHYWELFPIITDNRQWAEKRTKAMNLLKQLKVYVKCSPVPEVCLARCVEIIALDTSLALCCAKVLSNVGMLDALNCCELGLNFYRKIVQEVPSMSYKLARELNAIAFNFYTNRQLDAAMQIIDSSIALFPDYSILYESKGIVYLMQGKNQQALEMLEKVVALDPYYLQSSYPWEAWLYHYLKKLGLIE